MSAAMATVPLGIARGAIDALVATAGVKQVVEMMYSAGGGSAISTTNPLERAFRDMHTAAQHCTVRPSNYETVGRVLVGMEPGGPLLI